MFFAFSIFIMRALARLPAGEGAAAMNAGNVTVINPLLMAAFLGTGLLSAALAAMSFSSLPQPDAVKLSAAAALYNLGSVGVTVTFNVPLNNARAAAQKDAAAFWADYLKSWTRWNSVRGLASLAAGILLISAMAS